MKDKTTNILSKIKPVVKAIEPYSLKHYRAPVKINQNENPYDMPDVIKTAVNKLMSEKAWCRYPDFVPSALISQLAEFSQWKSDGILVGNGSNELIEALMIAAIEKNTKVLISQPTFTLYSMFAKMLGGNCKEVCLLPSLEFDVEAIRAESRQADLTIICSPNNPTGSLLERDDLRLILKTSPSLVIVDEAYHEFSRQSVVSLLTDFENLIVLRTFSKAMSMAGLRVGYLLGNKKLVEQISKAKLPYNLNIFSMTAAMSALTHFDLLAPQIENVIAERERLQVRLKQIPGVLPFPSQANFIVFQLAGDPRIIFDSLFQDGILVRDVSRYPMLDQCLRVTVGLPQENDRFITSLTKIMRCS